MPIVNDLNHLPRATPTPAPAPATTCVPDADDDVRFGSVIVDAYLADRGAHDLPTAHGTRIRHSNAGACARKLSLTAAGIRAVDFTPDPGAGWSFWLGHLVHEHVQQGVLDRYGDDFDVIAEGKVKLPGTDASGHVDLTLRSKTDDPDLGRPRTITVEIKTTSRIAYGRAIGDRFEPEGPDYHHLTQLALNATADDADEAVLVLMTLTPIAEGHRMPDGTLGADLGHRRYVSEWTLNRDEYGAIADREQARLNGILGLLDDKHEIAAPKIPGLPRGSVVIDADKGIWGIPGTNQHGEGGIVQTGNDAWMCNYCPFQQLCADLDHPGRVGMDDVMAALVDHPDLTYDPPVDTTDAAAA